MPNLEGDSASGPSKVRFDRRPKLEFHGSQATSDAGLLAYRDLDEASGLTAAAGECLREARTGSVALGHSCHLSGILRQGSSLTRGRQRP